MVYKVILLDGGRPATPLDDAKLDWNHATELIDTLRRRIDSPALQLIADRPSGANELAALRKRLAKATRQRDAAARRIEELTATPAD